MESKGNIKSLVINVLLRIICFLVFYVCLIVLGIAIFWGIYQFVCWVINPEILFYNRRATLLIIVSVAGLSSLAVMFAAYLIKPLFSSTKNKNENRREVKRNECPKLFAMIDELVEQTKCKYPKHVYLSPEVNACVFYDTSFYSIFFPVRKNLEIGLGLFLSTNVSELKSIIAHEFGHFSQRSMKVGSTVYVTNQIIYNLIYTKDSFEGLLDKWCLADFTLWRLFGVLTRVLTNQIKRLNVAMYRFVQKEYLRLSRQMEYDADNIACSCVGSDAFVSALCKIEIISSRKHLYERFLTNLMTEFKRIDDYWGGYDKIEAYLAQEDLTKIAYKDLLMKPMSNDFITSKLKVNDVWSSHPSLDDRIKNARSVQTEEEVSVNTESSWSLITDVLKGEIGYKRLKLLESQFEKECNSIDMEAFRDWVHSEIDNYFIPNNLKPYFDRNLCYFDIEECDNVVENPFTDENNKLLAEYKVALGDWNVLNNVKNESEIKEVRYDGTLYKKKDLPIEAHREYLELLYAKVVDIDRHVFHYLKQKSETPDVIETAYRQIFYVMYIERQISQVEIVKNNLIEELNRVVKRDEDEYLELIEQIRGCETILKQFIENVNMPMLSTFVKDKYLTALTEYAKVEHNEPSDSVNIEVVKEMFNIIDTLTDMHNRLKSLSYQMIVKDAKKILI